MVFPQGRETAYRHFEKSVELLVANPFLGQSVEGCKLREHPIPKTPFVIVYRLRGERLEIVRVWDMRREPDPNFSS
jgi:plasmid stabilization system protein ParE